MGCVFCKIISGELPSNLIYEDGSCRAFLDINPRAKGHTVVVPKVHAETVFDLNEELLPELILAVKKTMERIDEVLHPAGYNVGWNSGLAAGQAVPHLHIHVLPRYENDGGGNIHSIINNPGEISVEEVFAMFNK